MFRFRSAPEKDNELQGTYKIWGLENGGDEEFALFLGRAITIFGQPDWMEDDYEAMYGYCIEAEDENGEKLVLDLYHGPSGAAIGGFDTQAHKQAAEELAQMILSAEPTDYECESIYEDVPVRLKYIVRDGKAYVESEMLDFEDLLDEEEIE